MTYAAIPASALLALREVAAEVLDAVLVALLRSKSGSFADMLNTDAAFELLGSLADPKRKKTRASISGEVFVPDDSSSANPTTSECHDPTKSLQESIMHATLHQRS